MPGEHSVGSAAPVEQKAPKGHATQSSSFVIEMLSAASVPFWWRPDGHGSAADAPASQYEPAAHSKHAVSPCPCWYVPASHVAHVSCCAAGCTVPGLHSLCASEPVEHEEPAGQAVHWLAAARPGVLLKEPSVHGSGAEAPASQYEPATHSKHAVLPLSFMNLPATQSGQSFCPPSGCTVPGLQRVCTSEPVEHEEPEGQAEH